MDRDVPVVSVVPIVSIARFVPIVLVSVDEFMLFGMAPPVVARSIGPVVPTPRGPAGLGLLGPWDGDTAGVLLFIVLPLFIVPALVPICEVPVVCEPALGPLLGVLLLGDPEAPPPWARATLPQASAAAAASVVTMFEVLRMSISY